MTIGALLQQTSPYPVKQDVHVWRFPIRGKRHFSFFPVNGVGIVIIDRAVPGNDDIISDRDAIAGNQLCATADVYPVTDFDVTALRLKNEGGIDHGLLSDLKVSCAILWRAQIQVEIIA